MFPTEGGYDKYFKGKSGDVIVRLVYRYTNQPFHLAMLHENSRAFSCMNSIGAVYVVLRGRNRYREAKRNFLRERS